MIKYILIIALTFVNNVYASDIINITFLGTGTPRPDINKLGPSILLKYKEHEILFDAGRGITLRLDQINNNYSKIHDIYISHMHFDHIVGLADFWLTSNLWQKKKNTNVYGPGGIKEFCKELKKSYVKDLHYRYDKNSISELNCIITWSKSSRCIADVVLKSNSTVCHVLTASIGTINSTCDCHALPPCS